ncbi:DUF1877 family protein [Kitasatospora phosalacinea]|uniref:DUF1877 family protein n=1 Tax=Kitasatospora phosalacinea TaxID=2065 RepID=UPI0035D850E5
MSYDQQFSAVPPDELVLDPEWLADFVWAARERWPEEDAAEIAYFIEKDHGFHARFYTDGVSVPEDEADVRTLPVFGGTVVFRENGEAPFVVMAPESVRRAADYLAGVDFDALWAVVGEKVRVIHWDAAEDRAYRLYLHEGLTEFYGRAAAAGHAVVKAFWP